LAPLRISTSQIRPGFSVTKAVLPPGRKAIAHGESKLAIAVVLKGRPVEAVSALADGDALHDARLAVSANCSIGLITRSTLRSTVNRNHSWAHLVSP
jgi:hypothetical protein